MRAAAVVGSTASCNTPLQQELSRRHRQRQGAEVSECELWRWWAASQFAPTVVCAAPTPAHLGCHCMLQCVAVWCSVVQCVAVCCSVLQCVAVCYSVMLLQYTASHCYTLQHTWGSSHEFIQLIIIYARAPTLVAPAVAVVVEVWCVLMHVPFELLSVNVSVYHLLGTYIYTHTSSPFDPRIPTHNHTNTE